MFCIGCGAEGPTIDNFCLSCFPKHQRTVTLAAQVEVHTCAHCKRVLHGHRWEELGTEPSQYVPLLIEEALSVSGEGTQTVQVALANTEERLLRATVTVHRRREGLQWSEHLSTLVVLRVATCEVCSRRHGSYWESRVQLRATGRDIDAEELRLSQQWADELMRHLDESGTGDRQAFISRLIPQHGGLDWYLGSRSSGKALSRLLADRLGGAVTESVELHGRSDGVDLYRNVTLVRLPPYRAGDFVAIEDSKGTRSPFRVQSVRGGFTNLLDLRDYRAVRMRLADTLSLERIATPADLRRAVVVSQRGAEAQLLDPDHYSTITVLLPSDAPLGQEVEVLRFERDLYLVRGAPTVDDAQEDSTA